MCVCVCVNMYVFVDVIMFVCLHVFFSLQPSSDITVSLRDLQSLMSARKHIHVCTRRTCLYTPFLISSYLFELLYLQHPQSLFYPRDSVRQTIWVVSSKQISITLTGDSKPNKLSLCPQSTAKSITDWYVCLCICLCGCMYTCVPFWDEQPYA